MRTAKFAIPYLGQFLTYLTQIDEGSKSKTPEGLINMKKRRLIHKIISQVLNFQKMSCSLVPIPIIQDYLEKIETFDRNILDAISQNLEPKPNPNKAPPPMPEEFKEFNERKSQIIKNRPAKVKKNDTKPNPSMTPPVVLAQQKDRITQIYETSKSQTSAAFNELRDHPSSINIDKAREVTHNHLKMLHTNGITALDKISLSLIETVSKPKEPEQQTTKDDPKLSSSRHLSTFIEWMWQNDQGGFTPFDSRTALTLELAFLENKVGKCPIYDGRYMVDFKKMEQINTATNFSRFIQRRMNWIKEQDHRHQVNQYQAKIKELEEKLASLTSNNSQKTKKKSPI